VHRITGVPMEPRAAVGVWDPASGRYTVHAGAGGLGRTQTGVAGALGVPERAVRVLARDVGGNFGTRNSCYPEFALVAWAARRVGRPVKWTGERREAFLADYHGRDLAVRAELALDAEGHFLAIRAANTSNVGAHAVSFHPLNKGMALTGTHLEEQGELDVAIQDVPDADQTRFDDLATLLVDEYRANARKSLDRVEDAVDHLKGFFTGWRAQAISTDRILAYARHRQQQQAANATINYAAVGARRPPQRSRVRPRTRRGASSRSPPPCGPCWSASASAPWRSRKRRARSSRGCSTAPAGRSSLSGGHG
jgi:hypothetical protein